LRNPRGSSLEKRHLVATWARTRDDTLQIDSEAETRETDQDRLVTTEIEDLHQEEELHLIEGIVAQEAEPHQDVDQTQETTIVTQV